MTYVATKISYPLHTKVHILGKLVIPPTHLLISFMCYLSPTQLPTYSLNITLSTVYQLQQRFPTVQLLGTTSQSSFIVLGQRDNRTSSKSCHGIVRAGTVCQNLKQDGGQDNFYFSLKIQDGTRDRAITIFFFL